MSVYTKECGERGTRCKRRRKVQSPHHNSHVVCEPVRQKNQSVNRTRAVKCYSPSAHTHLHEKSCEVKLDPRCLYHIYLASERARALFFRHWIG